MNKLQEIQEKCKSSIHLNINQHRSYYETVDDYVKGLLQGEEDIEPNIFKKMKEINTVIDLQFYPHTPIGFYRILHYDLESALDEALKILKELNL